MVKRCDQFHTPLAYCAGNFTHNVFLWAKQLAVPRSHRRVPHGKAVMMHCDRTSELCTCQEKNICPLLSVESLCCKQWEKIVIFKIFRMPIIFNMKIMFSIRLKPHALRDRPLGLWGLPTDMAIHRPRVMLISKGWDCIGPPMKVDAKLCVKKPFGRLLMTSK